MSDHFPLSLFEAKVSLYPMDASGAPVLTSPVWMGACVESLHIRDVWLNRELRPTGRPFPKRRPLVPQYEITLTRIWVIALSNRAGFRPTRQPYVLDILWQEEDGTNVWHRETYYGVTIVERARESKDFEARDGAAFLERQVFSAESVVVTDGVNEPPPLANVTTYRVAYQSASETLDLYLWDSTTELFTAQASTTGRATLTYVPADRSDRFEVAFGGDPVATLQANGDFEATLFVAGVPTAADRPRLDFYAGAQRVLSITAAGIVYANQFIESAPTGTGINLYGGGVKRAVLTLAALIAPNFIEVNQFAATADSAASTADDAVHTADMA